MYSSVKRQISTMQKPLLYLHQPSISFGEYSVFDDSQVDGYLGIFNISSSGDIVFNIHVYIYNFENKVFTGSGLKRFTIKYC